MSVRDYFEGRTSEDDIYFPIKKYHIILSRALNENSLTPSANAGIYCYDEKMEASLSIYFFKNREIIPDNQTNLEHKTGSLCLPFDFYLWFVDLLQNTDLIVSAKLSANPDNNWLETQMRP